MRTSSLTVVPGGEKGARGEYSQRWRTAGARGDWLAAATDGVSEGIGEGRAEGIGEGRVEGIGERVHEGREGVAEV